MGRKQTFCIAGDFHRHYFRLEPLCYKHNLDEIMNYSLNRLQLYRCALASSFLLLAFVVIGCKEPSHPVDSHPSGGIDKHGSHTSQAAKIVLADASDKLQSGNPVTLQFHLEHENRPIADLVPLHERLVHLIAIREGLDQFSHIHPTVDAGGKMTVQLTFPVPGNYFLYVDYQPMGGSASTAKTQLTIPGDVIRAMPLIPNESPEITVENLKARVTVDTAKSEAKVTFQIRDEDDTQVSDLQPYLGAMGHLVIVSADGHQYVHAHPIDDAKASLIGTVTFGAHFQQPGIYKLWGQFQRDDEIITIPFVVDYQATGDEHSKHR